jgi:hypothetical protein
MNEDDTDGSMDQWECLITCDRSFPQGLTVSDLYRY